MKPKNPFIRVRSLRARAGQSEESYSTIIIDNDGLPAQ